jgi:hypothetical protein
MLLKVSKTFHKNKFDLTWENAQLGSVKILLHFAASEFIIFCLENEINKRNTVQFY